MDDRLTAWAGADRARQRLVVVVGAAQARGEGAIEWDGAEPAWLPAVEAYAGADYVTDGGVDAARIPIKRRD
jgi:hypothetical protein